MPFPPESPCLNIAIARLNIPEANHFAIWVMQAPFQRGYVHHDQIWPETLSQAWKAWLEVFSPQSLPAIPIGTPQPALASTPNIHPAPASNVKINRTSRLMQNLGISLWQWLFQGEIAQSLHQSQGIAIGQELPLQVRLDIRAPELIALPWEIMQPGISLPAFSLSREILFSRTTSDVHSLPPLPPSPYLNILLVMGENAPQGQSSSAKDHQFSTLSKLELEEEAARITEVLKPREITNQNLHRFNSIIPCNVDTLIQPTPEELISHLDKENYNVLFYAGHGKPGPDGGWLFLAPETTLNGTELAQVLVRNGVTLAVFNACWGAQPATDISSGQVQAIPRSSLAEVLIHHGVPAVLGMRDEIADGEALSFIQVFAQCLTEGMLIDQAVAVARQQLLTLYRFNQPAWTLPVLYMHPEFNGQLIQVFDELVTQLPTNSPTWISSSTSRAFLRSQDNNNEVWPIWPGTIAVGRSQENDVVIFERWVSQKHAEIFSRCFPSEQVEPIYFLKDISRFGTLIYQSGDWRRIHRDEVAITSGTLVKFGSSQGQAFEFVIETTKDFS
ncbi:MULTISPECIES: CHAT domain-containing protein [Okeania]|uniref:CHAT domain-containing protein n=1 Tax=Okeania hirsuta TaxID=1458930 RepID=A0A3N6PJI9_9CYAN|nr:MULTISPECIES: CHAT domain-containing protein [Okeania]NES75775.1 CHAT domain-containing protein [Okeania sp. SIO1H4]NES87815.1 CHAT domain-containing protein [Okeania sp. SIO2B9]NET19957.1 CHAT domain-containing protein [Okeania sp. SIO1H5]NET91791.1 CHAT domain-containing protein [Okeania sp. SIO1H2]RQH18599.1 CHAT domain-containing protein [Okeania hirsuta]